MSKKKKMREISQTFCKIQECQNWTKMREISQTFGKLQKMFLVTYKQIHKCNTNEKTL
jgi:hypothetical protein